MANVRVIQTILGYILPFALLFTALFMLEVTAELVAGLLFALINDVLNTGLDTTPDFPGPLSLLAAAFGFFPSFWDLGTVVFYGLGAVIAYAFFVIFAIVGGLSTLKLFEATSNAFLGIANDATLRAGMTLPEGYLTDPYSGDSDDSDDGGNGDGDPSSCPLCGFPAHSGECRF